MRKTLGIATLTLLAACAPDAEETSAPAEEAPEAAGTETENGATASEPEEAKAETRAAASSSKPKAECASTEKTVFSCEAGNGKTIAICAAESGTVEYRYGKGDAELTIEATQFASVPYSGGGESQIRANNGQTDYIVFSRMVRTNFTPGEPNNPAISDGVIAKRGDQVLNLQVCDIGAKVTSINYDLAEEYLDEVQDLFTEETGRADPSGGSGM